MILYLSCLTTPAFKERVGEAALTYVATHPSIEVLGVIAVASKTHQAEWTRSM